ncbi:MAG TPA: RES family NAD+ phosphorylase [Roseiarcus sp.]|nr:RES family NAD+ phosphorylase [Roseiarcus sp.]
MRKARDLKLLDAIDAFPRVSFEGRMWRIVREGRDPTLGSASQSRWCNGQFDVLYTSAERDGAIAEIHALLSQQPVFPSRVIWNCYELDVRSAKTLCLPDRLTLEQLGIVTSAYRERRYDQTQRIADAAFFLGFDGMTAPSARWECQSLVLFTDRLAPDDIRSRSDRGVQIDWDMWRREHQRKP